MRPIHRLARLTCLACLARLARLDHRQAPAHRPAPDRHHQLSVRLAVFDPKSAVRRSRRPIDRAAGALEGHAPSSRYSAQTRHGEREGRVGERLQLRQEPALRSGMEKACRRVFGQHALDQQSA